MLTREHLREVEVAHVEVYREHRLDPLSPPSAALLCRRLLGTSVQRAHLVGVEARLSTFGGQRHVYLSDRVSPARASWLVGHELAHVYWERVGLDVDLPTLEAMCDALGAALIAPSAAVAAALANMRGHRVHRLAAAFKTTQSVALLRIGEVTGRPVALVRERPTIVRGDDFAWPDLRASIARTTRDVHPLRITDEVARWGLMVRC